MDIMDYESYFDYWINNSMYVCYCCKHGSNLECEDNCKYFYRLTDEDIDKKNLSRDFGILWTCKNTDNFEFCKKFQESPCKNCFGPEGNYLYFESNGLIK